MKNSYLDIPKEKLHHAYFILGDKDFVIDEINNFLERELEFEIKNNPDYLRLEFDILKVEDARNISKSHYSKPSISDKKIFVLSANSITLEAQNMLLKIFEEPLGSTHFFFSIPSIEKIIPTLRSRIMILESGKEAESKINVKDFLKMSKAKRLEEIKNLLEDIKDEKESKIEVVNFIKNLEKEMYKNGTNKQKLLSIEKARQYATDISASQKIILEHIALTI